MSNLNTFLSSIVPILPERVTVFFFDDTGFKIDSIVGSGALGRIFKGLRVKGSAESLILSIFGFQQGY
ncbi:hypothetical protein AAF712_009520 [Marasmius tenuissimus]|uniref:Uncharacterized protein n=1 Tax=Marasmius tenuissimus TaxID=585030 RepID=A0ABR2ZRG2_9AGAR|nr:hypothetical protein PM082_024297 [Marasmius tenuissimus]